MEEQCAPSFEDLSYRAMSKSLDLARLLAKIISFFKSKTDIYAEIAEKQGI